MFFSSKAVFDRASFFYSPEPVCFSSLQRRACVLPSFLPSAFDSSPLLHLIGFFCSCEEEACRKCSLSFCTGQLHFPTKPAPETRLRIINVTVFVSAKADIYTRSDVSVDVTDVGERRVQHGVLGKCHVIISQE